MTYNKQLIDACNAMLEEFEDTLGNVSHMNITFHMEEIANAVDNLEKEAEGHIPVLVQWPDETLTSEMFTEGPVVGGTYREDFMIISAWPVSDSNYGAYKIKLEVLDT